MRDWMIVITALVFVGLGCLHIYWAFGGSTGSSAAVPQVNGMPSFKPTMTATFMVAAALFAAALAVAAGSGMILSGLPKWLPITPAVVLATILAARAVGDFRLVGFFKTGGDGRFATLDTYLYSPLCLALAISVATIVATRKA
jgi:hypothetical protein